MPTSRPSRHPYQHIGKLDIGPQSSDQKVDPVQQIRRNRYQCADDDTPQYDPSYSGPKSFSEYHQEIRGVGLWFHSIMLTSWTPQANGTRTSNILNPGWYVLRPEAKLRSLLAPIQSLSHPNRLPMRTVLFCVDWKTENSFFVHGLSSFLERLAHRLEGDALGKPIATTLSASSCSVQCVCPSGASL